MRLTVLAEHGRDLETPGKPGEEAHKHHGGDFQAKDGFGNVVLPAVTRAAVRI